MKNSEIKETIQTLKRLISTDNESCFLACEIIKRSQFPTHYKHIILEEIKDLCIDMSKKMRKNNYANGIDKFIELNKKIIIIHNASSIFKK